ncbi:BON domain-containing protein [Deefgea rivuli]|uniref:BON domain-containing protein n=1 Tax=Deefgea rivuli TaxID=400948 RepID=UPI00048554AA|nr:BON domain-containing protein [Deefgea rivuli]
MKQISLIATLLCSAVLATACSSTPEKTAAAPVVAAPAAAKPAADAAAVAKAVKMALDADPALKAFNLQVKGANDKKDPSKVDVTIDGSVALGEQMAQAGMIAEKVKGVQFVNNNIMPKN